LKPGDASKIDFDQVASHPLLVQHSLERVKARFQELHDGYIATHGEPDRFKRVLKGLIREAKQAGD
jgi:hypothetical protein